MTGMTLALGFLAPLVAITGAVAASAPIIIHLLNRRRFKVIDWAAMKFLLESLRKNRKRVRIEEIIMLVIRTLIILLLMAFLGMLIWQSQVGMLGKDGTRTIVFVLDDTYSLGQKYGAKSNLYTLEREHLIEQIENVKDDDTITILRVSKRGQGEPFFTGQISSADQRESLIDGIRGLVLSHARAPLSQAVEKASDILSNAKGAGQLVIFSDFRRVDLKDKADSELLRNILQNLQDNSKKLVGVSVLDYGHESSNNLTVESLEMVGQFVVANQDATFIVRVRNNGSAILGKANIKLTVKSKDSAGWKKDVVLQETKKVTDLAPGQSDTVTFKYGFREAGAVVLVATVEADDLPGDNSAFLAVDVKGAIDILVIDGTPVKELNYAESGSFLYALDPKFDQRFGFRSFRRNIGDIEAECFEDYDLVVLMNVESFENTSSAADPKYPKLGELEDYVANGGGLAIFTGDKLSKSFYTGPFFKDGKGLCPMLIDDISTPDTHYAIKGRSIRSHPVLADGRSGIKMAIGLVRFYSITKTLPSLTAGNPPVVLARFSDEDESPAIVEKSYGSEGGKVIMFLSSGGEFAGDSQWNDWAKCGSGSFIVVSQALASYLARKVETRYTAGVGEPISYSPDERFGSSKGTLTRYPSPDLGQTKVKLRAFEIVKRLRLLIEDTDAKFASSLALSTDDFEEAIKGVTVPLSGQQKAEVVAIINTLKSKLQALPPSGERLVLVSWLGEPLSNIMKGELRWNEVDLSGVYCVDPDVSSIGTGSQSRAVLFARNPDPIEGQLEPLGSREALEDRIGKVTNYSRQVGEQAGTTEVSSIIQKELWMFVGGLMVLLMAIELFLGQRFGHYGKTTTVAR